MGITVSLILFFVFLEISLYKISDFPNLKPLNRIFLVDFISFIKMYSNKQLRVSFHTDVSEIHKFKVYWKLVLQVYYLKPFKCRVFHVEVIRGQSITQGSIGRNLPRYPPWMSRTIKRSNVHVQCRPMSLKGLIKANIHSGKFQPVRYGMVRFLLFSENMKKYFLRTKENVPYRTGRNFQEWILAMIYIFKLVLFFTNCVYDINV